MSIRVTKGNCNTKALWDTFYTSEAQLGHERLFGSRLEQVVRWLKVRSTELPAEAQLSFLDIGCGLGDLAKRVRVEVPTAVPAGIDISPVAVAYAKNAFPNGTFEVADAARLPFGQGRFDFVWCGETLEHVDDSEAVVKEISRVVKPGGMVVLSTPYKNTIGGPEHVWSHSTEDMLRWHATLGGELIFLHYNVIDDLISQMMMMVVRVPKPA